MRNRLLTALSTVLALAPLSAARAQDAQDAASDDADVQSETDAAEVVDAASAVAPAGPARGRDAAPGTQHEVQRGDTLWDLSQKYLGSPWYWPKVWSYNPEIANPHFIFPGNNVRFFGAGEGAPARVDVRPVSGVQQLPAGEQSPDVDDGSDLLAGRPAELVTVSGPIVYSGPTNGFPLSEYTFVTDSEVDAAGKLEAAFNVGQFLSPGDVVYLRFKNRGSVRAGERHPIFRRGDRVTHPITGRHAGYRTSVLGSLVVTDVSGNGVVTAQIVSARDGIEREDLVGPAGELELKSPDPLPNASTVEGYVLAAVVPDLALLGEAQGIILDKGSADGVRAGNTFEVVRQQDQFKAPVLESERHQDASLPTTVIGACMVLEAKQHASTCLVTRSMVEFAPGDRVVMRPGAAPAATAQR
jgi:hypothetical protein